MKEKFYPLLKNWPPTPVYSVFKSRFRLDKLHFAGSIGTCDGVTIRDCGLGASAPSRRAGLTKALLPLGWPAGWSQVWARGHGSHGDKAVSGRWVTACDGAEID